MPEADRLEQETPPSGDPPFTTSHPLPSEVPDADALEQELPVSATDAPVPGSPAGIDDERTESGTDDDHEEAAP